MKIELIYEDGCPNAVAARRNLHRALSAAGLHRRWTEWNRSRPDTPDYARRFASPTVLVNGRDVAGGEPQVSASACRLYPGAAGRFHGAPSEDLILQALRTTRRPGAAPLLTLPGITLALLPKLACPACWPAYAGLMSALGLGFLLSARYLLAATALALLLVLTALAWGGRRGRSCWPLLVGLAASSMILVGKFVWEANPLVYTGAALLIGASLWNSQSVVSTRTTCHKCKGKKEQLS
jgi:hypothetical protein